MKPLASLSLAAIAGAGLGGAVLFLLPRGEPKDAEATAATLMRAAAERGLGDGRWQIVEPHNTREREFARDPSDSRIMQIYFPERQKVMPAPERDLTRYLYGDTPQFLTSYFVVGGPVYEGSGDDRSVSFEWRLAGASRGPSRRAWFRVSSGELFRLVERDAHGDLLRAIEQLRRGLDAWKPTPLPKPLAAKAIQCRSCQDLGDFAAFAMSARLPIYEPASLPPRFHRSEWGYSATRALGDRGDPLELAWIAYTDGLLKMNLLLTSPEQMSRLEAIARQQTNVAGRSGCPTSSADSPEDWIEDASAIVVHRRDDGCRQILRRDMPDAAVILVGFRGLTSDDYVRTIKSLVRVNTALKPGEVPVGGGSAAPAQPPAAPAMADDALDPGTKPK